MRIAYFGTPAFAVPTLARLLDSPHEVVAVVTQPDRRRGRGHHVVLGEVKTLAVQRGVRVLQPDRLSAPAFLDAFRALDVDLAVVAAYGRLLPQSVLDVPRRGFINVHASLLPRWRGAAPIHRAVLAGDRRTGVTIMRVVLELDAGPMIAQRSVEIGADETSDALESTLAAVGADLLVDVVGRVSLGAVNETPQDAAGVTYASRLERRESVVDWARPASEIHNQIRGLRPWPLAAVAIGGKRVLLLRARVEVEDLKDASGPAPKPGTVLTASGDDLLIASRPGVVRLIEVQPEGKRAMPIRDFLNGVRLAAGDRVGTIAAPSS